jgi:tetratricopeptide (TPR) repeat protein
VPHSIAEGVNATKGISDGEDIWLSVRQDFDKVGIGFNHFMVYFTARMYWGGQEQDIDVMLHEYCRLFYGPAEYEMLAFFAFCEANWQVMEKDKAVADQALALFASAQSKAEPDSIYGRRLALIDEFLKGLRHKSEQLGQKRGPVPAVRLVGDATDIVIDGSLDDDYWKNCPVSATGRLRELQTGRQPIFGTTFKTGWTGNSVYFAIRCDEALGEKPNVTATRDDDTALWYGDAVEILIETESHSYYQIAISPAGTITDLDRHGNKRDTAWDSQAEVATGMFDDHWTIEIRIPVTEDENDPLHQVIGRKPTQSLPWHLNICRQRLRENGVELSALSPSGTASFHEVMKFAHFFAGQSRPFEADPSVTDYLIASRAADNLITQRKHDEALAALVALAEGKVTDFQKSDALARAAACARALNAEEKAEYLAGRIPIVSVAKTVRMHNLLAARKCEALIEQFGADDLTVWPFWQSGEGYFVRGRAFSATGAGERAESDLANALKWTSDNRVRLEILLAQAGNRETNLQDKAGALEAYLQITDATANNGSSTYYYGVRGAARLLREQRKYDEALAKLRVVDASKVKGFWGGALLLDVGETLQAAGRKDEALAAYRQVLAEESSTPPHRQAAEAAIKSLGQP